MILEQCRHAWSSRKHPLNKTEFIAPMDAYPSQKSIEVKALSIEVLRYTSSLWNIISKHFI